MTCLICRQAQIRNGFMLVHLQRGEIHLRIRNVPALVCLSCGEAYLEEEVAVRLLNSAEDSFKAGMLNAQYEYPVV